MKKLLLLSLLIFQTAFALPPRTVTTEQDLGSLALRNFVKNPGAERNSTTGVTDSSGIASRVTTTPIEGVAEFQIDATATSQNVDWSSNALDQGLKGQNCEAKATIEGDASLYKLQVLLNSVVIAENTALGSSTNPQQFSINFPCGDLTYAPVLRLASTGNGAQLQVDSLYIGKATNVGTYPIPAQFVGAIEWAGAANCIWSAASAGSGAYADFPADTDCSTPTVEGGITAPGTKVPQAVLTNAKPGTYLVKFKGYFYDGASNMGWRVSDGTNTGWMGAEQFSSGGAGAHLEGSITYATGGSVTFKPQAAGFGGAASGGIQNQNTGEKLRIEVYYFPTASQTIVSTAQQNLPTWTKYLTGSGTYTPPAGVIALEVYLVGGGGGGGAVGGGGGNGGTTTLGTSLLTATGGVGGSGSGAGVGGAGGTSTIASPAYGGNNFTGGTGSMSQILSGQTGLSGAGGNTCFGGAGGGQLNTGSTAPSGAANTGSGGAGGSAGSGAAGGAGGGAGGCVWGAIIPNPASSYAYAVGAGGAPGTTGGGNAAGTGSVGGIYIKEIYSTQSPFLLGSVTSKSTSAERIERARITNSGTPAVLTQSGTWISSITSNGTGDMTLNFPAGAFTVAPTCVCSAETGGGAAECFVLNTTAVSTTAIRIGTKSDAGVSGNYDLHIQCMGPR